MAPDRAAIRRQLLAWYRAEKRDLPFRRTKDPYRILVAEFLLQRTRMTAGLPYYERFLATFPTVRDLAGATEADVLRVWEGLGFYGRARNLHRAAKAIVARHRGRLPADFAALDALPGVGEYTAGAVGSIAFSLRVPAVDGNVTRVLARIFRIEDEVSRGPGNARIRAIAADMVPGDNPGEWNQAVMELGATVCVPRAPRCPVCPVSGECLAAASGVQSAIPVRRAEQTVPVTRVAFAVAYRRGAALLIRRTAGLHAGMYGLPGGDVHANEGEEAAIRRHLKAMGLRALNLERLAPVHQSFSHLRWEGWAFRCRVVGHSEGAEWIPITGLADIPIVPVHRRLLARRGAEVATSKRAVRRYGR